MSRCLDELLDEFAVVLKEERSALTRLDRDTIEACANQKLELDALLRATPLPDTPPPQSVAKLQELQAYARQNQRLLAHARACVQGVLNLVAGAPAVGHPSLTPRVAPNPVALNIRG